MKKNNQPQHKCSGKLFKCINPNCDPNDEFCFECLKKNHKDHNNNDQVLPLSEVNISIEKKMGHQTNENEYSDDETDQIQDYNNDSYLNTEIILSNNELQVSNFYQENNFYINEVIELMDKKQAPRALEKINNILEQKPQIYLFHHYKGCILNLMNQEYEAFLSFAEAINLNQYHLDSFIQIGITLLKLKQCDEAFIYFDNALKLDPYNLNTVEQICDSLVEFEKFQDALDYCDDAFYKFPNNIALLQRKGNLLLSLNRENEAVRFFNSALCIDPNNTASLLGQIISLNRLKKYDEVLKVLYQPQQIDIQNEKLIEEICFSLNRSDKFTNALFYLGQFLSFHQNNYKIQYEVGFALNKQGIFKESIKHFKIALQLNSFHFPSLYEIGYALLQNNNIDDALEYFSRAEKLAITYPLLCQIGFALNSKGEFQKASEYLDNAFSLVGEKGDIKLVDEACFALFNLEKFEQATKYLKISLGKNPQYSDHQYLLAFALQQLGNYKESIRYFNQFLAQYPTNAFVLMQKGFSLLLDNQNLRAYKYFEMAVAMDPLICSTYKETIGTVAIYFNSSLIKLDNLIKFDGALDYFNQSLKEMPYNFFFLFAKGQILMKMDRYLEAFAFYKKALSINPKSLNSLNQCGIALNFMKCYSEALDYFEQALILSPNDPIIELNKQWTLFERQKKLDIVVDQYSNALNYYIKAIMFFPKNQELVFRLNYCLNKLTNYYMRLENAEN